MIIIFFRRYGLFLYILDGYTFYLVNLVLVTLLKVCDSCKNFHVEFSFFLFFSFFITNL